MRDDVEAQVGAVEFLFQRFDLTNEFARRLDVIAPPIVSEDVERIVIAVGAGIVPIAVAVAAEGAQRLEQFVIDVNLRPVLQQLRRLDDALRH